MKFVKIFDSMDIVFSTVFIAECIIKVVSIGFIWEQNSYLRDSWNQLDFLIVFFTVIEFILKGSKLFFLKVIRLMRILRPLRFISRNQSMKLVVIALLDSFGGIANVVIVIVLCWVMISILGINFIKKKMGYCDIEQFYSVNYDSCVNVRKKKWMTYPWNMDNIQSSMLTIFVFATLEGWNDLVYTYLDSNEAQYGPIYENRLWILIFNLFLIQLCAFFFVDLFVGVIFLNYVLAEEKVRNKNISSDQLRWIKIQK